ncbi:Hpt domain-containing protein [Sporofaciens musculi]|jgi:HPt (histidine-containing phosphotransfer) domain-containing protein|uniref:Hpt domain-containing protein n=1 Tax=Sporofaciens musculi TaxID=2681861 RepID=UPI00258998BC|nr:Hpt domain-containing protein [Sporofaciens musculi]
MTVRECYEAMGADYEDVFGRLRKDERIQKFVLKLLNDKSYELLMNSMETGNMDEAFRAAHTLKGVCQNLSITALYHSSAELADRLRGGQEYGEDVEPLLEQVKKDYTLAMDCIRKLA